MESSLFWAVGKVVDGKFGIISSEASTLSHTHIFNQEHKAWEFINTKLVEEFRGDYTVRPVNIIPALKDGIYYEKP